MNRPSSFLDRISQWVATPGVSRADERVRLAPVLAVAAHKGGVGKTTTSVNLAAAAARFQGVRVLVVDLDPQGHVSASVGRLIRGAASPLSTCLAAASGPAVAPAVLRTTLETLSVTGWDPQLQQLELQISQRSGWEQLLVRALAPARQRYDLIVLDCPPSLGPLTQCALAAATHVLVPCDISPLAVRGVDSMIQAIGTVSERVNPTLDVLGIVMTRVDGRTSRLNEEILDTLHVRHGTLVLETTIPLLSAYVRAQQEAVDIHGYEPAGRASAAYRDLAEELRPDLVGAGVVAPATMAGSAR